MKMTGQPLHFTTVGEWRTWLEANHATQDEVWLTIYKRHAETPSVTLTETVEEALCFGWIDSQMQPIDGDRHAQRFTPRRKTSNWSERNRERAARLIEQGRMTYAALPRSKRPSRTGDGTGLHVRTSKEDRIPEDGRWRRVVATEPPSVSEPSRWKRRVRQRRRRTRPRPSIQREAASVDL